MKILLFLLIFWTTQVFSQEMRFLNRSPQALLMGDAYTSLADDEYTLFYNPAALAKNSGVEMYFLNPHFGVTNALGDLDRFEDFPSSDAVAINERLQGFPVHAQLGITPGFKIGGFGLSYIANSTMNLVLRNAIHPALDLDYRYDKGFVMGYAHSFGSLAGRTSRKSKSSQGSMTSIGASFKYIQREGTETSYDLFGTKLLNDINSGLDDVEAIKEAIGYSRGKGIGFDLGVLHTIRAGGTEMNFGASVLDIADTRFSRSSDTEEIPIQEMSFNLGASYIQKFGIFKSTFSVDLHPLEEPVDFARKIHLGIKFEVPLIDIMLGFNGGYLSYGLGLNLWPFHLMAGLYSVESGSEYKSEKSGRGILYLSLLNIDLDL